MLTKPGVAMNLRLMSAMILGLALGAAAVAQDTTSAAPDTAPPSGPPPSGAPGRGQFHGPRGESGLLGTVTAVASDYYTMKTDAGDLYTVHFSANTRILKQTIQRGNPGDEGQGGEAAQRPGPQMLQPSDIKAGDTIVALGEVEPSTKSVGAMMVLLVDPERARMMHDMAASYGKTWLMGQVTAINGNTITILGRIDNAPHTFTTTENTRFRKGRQPIALTDLQVGDRLRVEGAIQNGVFVAASVSIFGPPPGEMPTLPRNAPHAAQPD